MSIVISVLICLIGITFLFFRIPYSRTQTEFDRIVTDLISQAGFNGSLFSKEDIKDLPSPVQRYFTSCGYIGTPKMTHIRIDYQDVDFLFNKDKFIKIDYTQYNFASEPNRIAYIDSSMYGIPFEGLDSFLDGHGSMKGVLAKLFTLFNQTGDAMDQSSLVTYLSEVLFIPSLAIQNSIQWEEMDDLHAKATISYYGKTVSGIFTFRDNGEMSSFETDDRFAVATDGSSERIKWSVTCDDYVEIDGIKKPTNFKAIWHYDSGDLIYFDGKGEISAYN
ncbi:MAG: hypothetical protein PWQ55_2117 [Chloroflexota bacterium]|nr:hypothetical protein [Chloroflexota bacterium]